MCSQSRNFSRAMDEEVVELLSWKGHWHNDWHAALFVYLQPLPFQSSSFFPILTVLGLRDCLVEPQEWQTEEPWQWWEERCTEKKKTFQKGNADDEQTSMKWTVLVINLLMYCRLEKLPWTALRSILLTLVADPPPSLLISTGRLGNHWNLRVSSIYGPRSNQTHSAFYVGSEQWYRAPHGPETYTCSNLGWTLLPLVLIIDGTQGEMSAV